MSTSGYRLVDTPDGTSWVLPNTHDDLEDDSFADGTIAALDGMIASDYDGEALLASSGESVSQPTAPADIAADTSQPPARGAAPARCEGAPGVVNPSTRPAAAAPRPASAPSARSTRVFVGVAVLVLVAALADSTALARSMRPAARASPIPPSARPAPTLANRSDAHGSPACLGCLQPPKPCRLAQAVLSLGLGALGIAVGVPYVPGMTDNLLVGALGGLAPLVVDLPYCESINKAVAQLSDFFDKLPKQKRTVGW